MKSRCTLEFLSRAIIRQIGLRFSVSRFNFNAESSTNSSGTFSDSMISFLSLQMALEFAFKRVYTNLHRLALFER